MEHAAFILSETILAYADQGVEGDQLARIAQQDARWMGIGAPELEEAARFVRMRGYDDAQTTGLLAAMRAASALDEAARIM